MHPVLVRVRVFVPHIVELSLSLPHVTALSPSFSRLSLCFFRCAHSVQCSRLCILESRGDQGGDKTFMLNSKSISRVKTGSDGFIRCIDFLPDGLTVTHFNKAHCFLDLWRRLRIIYVCTSTADPPRQQGD
ncbi:hypothetical protein EDB84DRAFT_1548911 [Lactarius hengduanensis]|nr:hypothetical protein EDB84DRAFT_1548911 [Lactarius hengduanensis]